jgi:hypothetical protein
MLTIFFFILALSYKIQSLSCTTRNQCNLVTTNPNFVECVSGQCQCLNAMGFDGNASTSNQCRCDAPSSIYYQATTPYCIQFSDAAASKVAEVKAEYQKSVVDLVYQSLVWPTPAVIMGALIQGQPSLIGAYIADDAKGRVDPLGKFVGHDGVVEYFYGTVWTGSSRIIKSTMKKLVSNGNIVASDYVMTFQTWDNNNVLVGSHNLSQSGTFTFNENGLIQSMDLVIHNLGAQGGSSTVKTPELLGTICYLIMNVAKCNSTNDPEGYYTSSDDCYNHMANVYPYGTWDNLYFNGNCTSCRFFHALLSVGRPQVHCKHTGKTGGGKCLDHPYDGYFLEDF